MAAQHPAAYPLFYQRELECHHPDYCAVVGQGELNHTVIQTVKGGKKMKKQSGWKQLKPAVLFILLMGAVPALSWSATISGTVRDSTGTAITGTIGVNVYRGDPCGSYTYVMGTWTNSTNGGFAIGEVPAGTYYLKTNNNNYNYVDEWWNGHSPDPSDHDCNLTSSVTVAENDTLTDIDFRLDIGAVISGTVRDSTGLPITGDGIEVTVYASGNAGDPCTGWDFYYVKEISTNSFDGTYMINGLPAGTYYLQSHDNNMIYVGEWWNGESPDPSDYHCGLAQSITVTLEETVPGMDFRLERGATISGTVRDSTGTPITGAHIIVATNLSDPCNSGWIGMHDYNPANGTYALVVPAGTYYLRTYDHGQNYVSEWWNGVGQYPSDFDCNLARSIPVEAGNTYLDYDFWLDTGETISGTIYNDDGSLTLARMIVCANSAGCGGAHYGCNVSDHNGNYSVSLLPRGTTAYLYAGGQNYVDEHYDGGSGSTDCNDALGVTAGSTGIHFYMGNSSQGTSPGIGPGVYILLLGEP